MSHPPAGSPRRGHLLGFRLIAGAVTVFAGAVLLEAASWIAFRLADGRTYSWVEARRERGAVRSVEGGVPDAAPGASLGGLVPHPFMGFAQDPARDNWRPRKIGTADRHGFVVAVPSDAPDAFHVIVAGGSVAYFACTDGAVALVEALHRSPALRDRPIEVRCLAFGGFKQPQPALALAYIISLGEPVDAVVELDGVNEVALSWTGHIYRHTFPFYPRDWDRLVSNVPGPQQQRALAHLDLLQRLREQWGHAFDGTLRWSLTAHWVWRAGDRWLASGIADSRQALARIPAASDYRARGPSLPVGSDLDELRTIATEWASASRLMASVAHGAGAVFVHALQPNQYVSGSKSMTDTERGLAIGGNPLFQNAVEKGYPLLQAEGAQLAQEGIRFVDLTRAFERISEPLYVDTCCHVNATGSSVLAARIGAALVDELGRRTLTRP